MPIIDVNIPVV